MELKLIAQDLAQTCKTTCDALVLLVPETFKPENSKGKASATKTTAPHSMQDLIAQAMSDGDFDAKLGKILHIYRHTLTQATRLVLVGAGDGSTKSIKSAVTTAVVGLKSNGSKKLVISLNLVDGTDAASAQAAFFAAADASYVYTTTKPKADARKFTHITVAVRKDALSAAQLIASQAYITPAIAGIEYAKEWGNRPANHATPSLLGKAAQSLDKYKNISVDVLGLKEVSKLGMGSFMSVAQGSDQPLRFIVLKYSGAAKTDAPT
ncbi:MAG TPA: M17 family peptidase N-terminal domain-containing protein, partial [Burkholderiaceae bacterium]|nr:M17 family peptidase N-terminal domain-containing protein [Burkholderiaceae bacterium]